MKRLTGILVAGAAIAMTAPIAVPAFAQIITSTVVFPKGGSSATISDTIKGDQIRDYVISAQAGQVMSVELSGSSIVYFNLLPPGSNDEAIFTGSVDGNSFSGTLSQSGAYKVRVYQMRATARRGEAGNFKLNLSVTGERVTGLQVGSSSAKSAKSTEGTTGLQMSGGNHGSIVGIQGMDGVEAFDTLQARGFTNVDSFSSGDTLYGVYYYAPKKLCVQTTSADGKIADIRDIQTHPKCK